MCKRPSKLLFLTTTGQIIANFYGLSRLFFSCLSFSRELAKIGRNHLAPPSRLNSLYSLMVARTAMVLPLLVISVLGLGIEVNYVVLNKYHN